MGLGEEREGGATVGLVRRPPLLRSSGMATSRDLRRERPRLLQGSEEGIDAYVVRKANGGVKEEWMETRYSPSIRGQGWAHAGSSCKNNKK
jgi:hypothetical protein